MIALNSLFAALTRFHTGQLFAFAVKLLNLPAKAGHLLYGFYSKLRNVVCYDIIRALGRKRQAEQFQLMTFREIFQVNDSSMNLLLRCPCQRVCAVIVAFPPGFIDQSVTSDRTVVKFA